MKWTYGEVFEVVGNLGERRDEVMLPKARRASDVVALDLLLTQVEENVGLPVGQLGIEAQIETAECLTNVEEVSGASTGLGSIVFGPADFTASIGMPVITIDEYDRPRRRN
jgi:citrate lyase subunit beta/citryl-CoA lyase